MNKNYVKVAALCLALLVVGTSMTLRSAQAQGDQNFGSNWQAYYWNNQNFTGNPAVARTDPAINFNWQTGSPDPAIPPDHFSARWYGTFTFAAGTYRFRAGADDGIRATIDGNFIINMWQDAVSGFQVAQTDVALGAGDHQIIVDYYENMGNAGVQFSWSTVSGGSSVAPAAGTTPVPTTAPLGPSTLAVSQVKAVVIVDLANVRGGPGTNFTPIAQVSLNQVFGVVANNGANTWFLIELPDGRRGWIFRRMIYLYNGDWTKLPVLQAEIQPPAPLADVQGEAIVPAMVRDAPTRRGGKVGVINQGQNFKILRLSRNHAWVFIDADGLQGWVFVLNVKVVFGQLGWLPKGD